MSTVNNKILKVKTLQSKQGNYSFERARSRSRGSFGMKRKKIKKNVKNEKEYQANGNVSFSRRRLMSLGVDMKIEFPETNTKS